MKISTLKQRIRILAHGFSMVELLIGISIIGILATLAITNYSEYIVLSRDAQRREAIRSYSHSLELYKGITGNYFVFSPKKGTGTCTTATAAADFVNGPNNQYILHGDDVGGAENISCTGYKPIIYFPSETGVHQQTGGGQGRMTRRGILNYSQTSIADALIDVGVLNKIVLDPLTKDFTTNTDAYNDFTLVLCQDIGTEPQNARQATTYTIYSKLERPTNATESATAQQSCGGFKSKYPRKTAQ